MIQINGYDIRQPIQRRYTFDGFPFDEPEIAQALAHAIALLLRNDTPVSTDEDNTGEDNTS
jgi:hypothetical protein